MKKSILTLTAFLLFSALASAQSPKTFTTVKELPITSVKNQYRSGTCWDFATLGFLESEILRWETGGMLQMIGNRDLAMQFYMNYDNLQKPEL